MPSKVINVENIRKAIKAKQKDLVKLKRQIADLEGPMKFSSVYRDGLAYGIAYKTGYNQEIEMYEEINNWPERLEENAKRHFEFDMEGDPEYPVYIVGLRPEKIIKVITSEGARSARRS